jgi:hypothetical protein
MDINNDEDKRRICLPVEGTVFTLGNGHAYWVDNLQSSTPKFVSTQQEAVKYKIHKTQEMLRMTRRLTHDATITTRKEHL